MSINNNNNNNYDNLYGAVTRPYRYKGAYRNHNRNVEMSLPWSVTYFIDGSLHNITTPVLTAIRSPLHVLSENQT